MANEMGREKTFEVIANTIAAVDALTKAVQYSEHAWHWKKLREYAEGLFAVAPFKPGDRVRLTKTPEISEKVSWGWLGAKHFMVKGAMATVRYVDFSGGHFEAWVHMDDETWKSSIDGKLNPVDRPALYHFWDTGIELVPTSPLPSTKGTP